MYTDAGNLYDNRVTLTFDPLTSRSMYAEQLPLTAMHFMFTKIGAQAVLLLKLGDADTQSQTQLIMLAVAWEISKQAV